jgi:hypothetical protein
VKFRQTHEYVLTDLIQKRNRLAHALAFATDSDRLTDRYLALEEQMVAVQDEIDLQRVRWSSATRPNHCRGGVHR